jgi:hypothetical protein
MVEEPFKTADGMGCLIMIAFVLLPFVLVAALHWLVRYRNGIL